MDVPANSWILGLPDNAGDRAVIIATDSKYGYRGANNSLSVTLIRGSYDPDPYPEFGMHSFRIGVSVADSTKEGALIQKAYDYDHPLSYLSGTIHEGKLPLSMSFISLENDDIAVSAVKCPEDGLKQKAVIIRVYETSGKKVHGVLRFAENVKNAVYVDVNENPIDCGLSVSHEDNTVKFEVEASSIATLLVEF